MRYKRHRDAAGDHEDDTADADLLSQQIRHERSDELKRHVECGVLEAEVAHLLDEFQKRNAQDDADDQCSEKLDEEFLNCLCRRERARHDSCDCKLKRDDA